jgi:hypothetical protein
MCGAHALLDGNIVAQMCNAKDMIDQLRASPTVNVDYGRVLDAYNVCKQYLHRISHDMVDFTDLFTTICIHVDIELAVHECTHHRNTIRMIFTHDSLEYQVECRRQLRLFIDKLSINHELCQKLMREIVVDTISSCGRRVARHYFRIDIGTEYLNEFDVIADDVCA